VTLVPDDHHCTTVFVHCTDSEMKKEEAGGEEDEDTRWLFGMS